MTIYETAITRLKDYANNPRNNDLAVEKVKYSIQRFGFLFPVIVDMNYVIVAGHTRVKACRELGIQTVPCIIADELSEEQIRLFRLVDNKTSEYSSWDFNKLKSELAQVDLTIGDNQIFLERFELGSNVFDVEPEQAVIKIPTWNFMDSGDSVSSIEDEDDGFYDETGAPSTSAEDIAVRISADNTAEPEPDSELEQKRGKPPAAIQFRFGDIAIYISKIELEMLNAKYAEYFDSGEAHKRSFVDFLLEGVGQPD